MNPQWSVIEQMVAELGDLCALETEAAAFPELAVDPVLGEARLAVLRATDAVSRVAAGRSDEQAVNNAREIVDAAVEACRVARNLILHARAQRHQKTPAGH